MTPDEVKTLHLDDVESYQKRLNFWKNRRMASFFWAWQLFVQMMGFQLGEDRACTGSSAHTEAPGACPAARAAYATDTSRASTPVDHPSVAT